MTDSFFLLKTFDCWTISGWPSDCFFFFFYCMFYELRTNLFQNVLQPGWKSMKFLFLKFKSLAAFSCDAILSHFCWVVLRYNWKNHFWKYFILYTLKWQLHIPKFNSIILLHSIEVSVEIWKRVCSLSMRAKSHARYKS